MSAHFEIFSNMEMFRTGLDGALSNLVSWKPLLPITGELEQDDL